MLNRAQVQQIAHLKKKMFTGKIWHTEEKQTQNYPDHLIKYIKSHLPHTVAPVSFEDLCKELDWTMVYKKTATKADAVIGSNWFTDFDFINKFKGAYEGIKQHGYIALTLPIGIHNGDLSIQPKVIHRLSKENELGVSYFTINHISGQYPVQMDLATEEFDYDNMVNKLQKYDDSKELYMSVTFQKNHTGAFKW